MYSTCLFCHDGLGANEVVEHFPIGRRLAFDEQKGRLWVICRSCERWNLTPIAERWEAIEECEKLFRDTRLRMSTDHIGLARAGDRLELVRVGQPQRPEMAAWRYGDQFGRRRRRSIMITGVGIAAAGVLASGVAGILLAGGGGAVLNVAFHIYGKARNQKVIARVPTANGHVKIPRDHVKHAKIVRTSDTDWSLSLQYATDPVPARMWPPWSYVPAQRQGSETLVLGAREALPALTAILPTVNGSGGNRRDVQSAVKLVDEEGSVMRLLNNAATRAALTSTNADSQGLLSRIPLEVRLALEMVTHEDDERRALEGELAVLEARWKEAEEIANISDNMFLPPTVGDWMRKLRG